MEFAKTNNGFQKLENLENRVLFNVISITDFGAQVNDGKNDMPALQAALKKAKSGDTIQFDVGQYDLNGTAHVPSNITLQGASHQRSKLVFTTGKSGYALDLSNDSNVTLDSLAIRANDGVIWADGHISNVQITNNDFAWGYDGTYYNRLVVHQPGSADKLMIEHNNFHDSLDSDRNVDLYNVSNSSYSYNTFHLVHDGGHMDGTTTNFKFVGNVGTGIHRMGLELQDHDTTDAGGNNILIANNVFTDWYQPFWESFGLSIPPQHAKNVTIRDNYLSVFAVGKNSPNSGWGQTDSSGKNRPGYGIEASVGGESMADASTCITSGNTLVGPWITAIVFGEPGTQLKNNATYGGNPWGAWAGEGGLGHGSGSMKDLGGNKVVGDLSKAPAPSVAIPDAPADDTQQSTDSGISDVSSSGPAYLSDLKWAGTFNGWGEVEIDQSLGDKGTGDGGTITINGKQYDKGLGVGISSSIVYTLAGKYNTFNSDVGIDDAVGKKGSMTFEVWGDGKKLFDSGVLMGTDPAKSVKLDITGVQQLRLITTSAGDGGSHDHGDWAGARVS